MAVLQFWIVRSSGLVGRCLDLGQAAATSFLRGRPRGRLRGTTTPAMKSCPPHTPHGSRRSSAPARHSARTGQPPHSDLASSTSLGDSAKKSSGSSRRHGSCSSTTPAPKVGASRTVVLISFSSCRVGGVQLRKSERPRFPGFGFRGLEAAVEEGFPYIGGLQALVPGKVRTSATTPV